MIEEQYPHKWRALLGLCLLSFTAFLDFTIVNTALPFIQKDLNANVIQLQWITNIFAMILSATMIAAGRLADLLGRTKLFYIGIIIFGIAAFGAGNASNIEWLIFFRALQSLGASIAFTVSIALLPQAFPPDEQTRATGIYSAITGAGLALGPFIGGVLINLLSWRWVFWVNLPIIVIGFFLCIGSLKPAPKADSTVKIDWGGLIFLLLSISTLIYGIIDGEQQGWARSETWIYLGIAFASLITLFFIENKVAFPLLDLSIFKKKVMALTGLNCVVAGAVSFVLMFFDPLYLSAIRNNSAFIIGVIMFAAPLTQVMISLLLNRLTRKFSLSSILLFSMAAGIVTGLLHSFINADTAYGFIVLAVVLMGLTWGIANAITIVVTTQSVETHKMGGAVGTVFTIWNVAASIILAITTAVFHNREQLSMNTQLLKENLNLTTSQHTAVSTMLSDPAQATTLLRQFVGEKAAEILQAFNNAFLEGFHHMAWVITFIMAMIFLVAFFIHVKNK